MEKKRSRFVMFLLVSVFLVWLDQYTKKLAVAYLKGKDAIAVWKDVFELRYLENRGAAFGMLQGKQAVFFVIALLVLAGVCYILYKMPAEKRYIPLTACLAGICSGAVGNMIDRMVNGYVVDFLYFSLIDFPIFNVADIYVTVATACLVILVLFYYKDEEFQFLSKK